MKNIFWKAALMIGVLMLTAPTERATATPLKVPEPDPGLLAAVDAQTNVLVEGIVTGDFEAWYPGLFPDYIWTREIRELSTGGLYQVGYTIFEVKSHNAKPIDQMSLLLFRPLSTPGSAIHPAGAFSPLRSAKPAWRVRKPGRKMSPAEVTAGLLESVLVTAQSYAANQPLYAYIGDRQNLSLVSRLPADFPGMGKFGEPFLRRVTFHMEGGRKGLDQLVMTHTPLLLDVENPNAQPYRLSLTEDVSLFELSYWDAAKGRWAEELIYPGSIPVMVRVMLGLGNPHPRTGLPEELVSRIVAIPATVVPPELQRAGTPGVPPGPPPSGAAGNGSPRTRASSSPENSTSQVVSADPIPEPVMSSSVYSGEHDRSAIQGVPARIGNDKQVEELKKRDATHDIELEWLGRSGVELARYILASESTGPSGVFSCLNQRWAGGPGDPTSPVASLPLEDFVLGNGLFSIRIEDWDRRFNVNVADEMILRAALRMAGTEVDESPAIVDSVLDWLDPDDTPRPNGAELDFYRSGYPPYWAKNGPIDDLAELLWIHGVTPELFWGFHNSAVTVEPESPPGLVDLFTPLSGRLMNINTASEKALQVVPLIDPNIASAIVQARNGPDGAEGTEDDMPFRSPQEIATRVPGFNPAMAQQIARYFSTRSLVFEVTVESRIGEDNRTYVGLLCRHNPQDIQLLHFFEK